MEAETKGWKGEGWSCWAQELEMQDFQPNCLWIYGQTTIICPNGLAQSRGSAVHWQSHELTKTRSHGHESVPPFTKTDAKMRSVCMHMFPEFHVSTLFYSLSRSLFWVWSWLTRSGCWCWVCFVFFCYVHWEEKSLEMKQRWQTPWGQLSEAVFE